MINAKKKSNGAAPCSHDDQQKYDVLKVTPSLLPVARCRSLYRTNYQQNCGVINLLPEIISILKPYVLYRFVISIMENSHDSKGKAEIRRCIHVDRK